MNIGSFAGLVPTMYFSVYSATKAYVNFLSRTIAAEHPAIDIMVLNPNEVQTNMTYNKPLDFLTILPEKCVEWCLMDLPHEEISDGRKYYIFKIF